MRSNIERRNGRRGYCIACAATSVFVLMHGAGETLGAIVDINLVVLSAPSGSDTVASLPASQSTVGPGSAFFVEVWAQTTHPNGFTSVSLDIAFDSVLATGVSITHTALFSELQNGTIDDPGGLVDDLSGSHLGPCTDEVGVSPNWARVAVVEMSALGQGTLLLVSAPTGTPAFGTAICAVGDIDPGEVSFGEVTLHIIGGEIPAVSTWGLVAMTLLLLVTGTLVVARRQWTCDQRTS
jgi:hypothetical protein